MYSQTNCCLYRRLAVEALDLGLRMWMTLPSMEMVLLLFNLRRMWSLTGKMRERTRGKLTKESMREMLGYVVI